MTADSLCGLRNSAPEEREEQQQQRRRRQARRPPAPRRGMPRGARGHPGTRAAGASAAAGSGNAMGARSLPLAKVAADFRRAPSERAEQPDMIPPK